MTTARRVLVVEDQFLVAHAILAVLAELRLVDVVGPVSTLDEAWRVVARERLDLAILDVNVSRQTTEAIAAEIAGRGIPLLFVTAQPRSELPPDLRDRPYVSKPIDPHALRKAILAGLSRET